jgi:hypothetical protein
MTSGGYRLASNDAGQQRAWISSSSQCEAIVATNIAFAVTVAAIGVLAVLVAREVEPDVRRLVWRVRPTTARVQFFLTDPSGIRRVRAQ